MDNNILNKLEYYNEIVIKNYDGCNVGIFKDKAEYAIANCISDNQLEAEANAAFICKAVNNYDSLIENLKRIVDRIEESELQNSFPSAYNRAKEAIQKAEQ